jgi:small conductance mechanosensitive channel
MFLVTFDEVVNEIIKWLASEGVRLLIGVVVLIIIFIIVNITIRSIQNKAIKKHKDPSLVGFLTKTFEIVLKILVFIAFLGYIGIDTAGVGAVITSIGLAIGLALQGTLANFAGGIVLLFLHPFKTGDYIEGQNVAGTIDNVGLFYTSLITPDQRVIYIPNGALSNGNITNYSKLPKRRQDFHFLIGLNDDFNKAKNLIEELFNTNSLILTDPKVFITIEKYDSSGIIILVRIWTKSENYWEVNYWIYENVKTILLNNGITFPYQTLTIEQKKGE